jgi:hypothetical protein
VGERGGEGRRRDVKEKKKKGGTVTRWCREVEGGDRDKGEGQPKGYGREMRAREGEERSGVRVREREESKRSEAVLMERDKGEDRVIRRDVRVREDRYERKWGDKDR